MKLTIVIPFYNGHEHISRLISSIPNDLPILVIDDISDKPLHNNFDENVTVLRIPEKGYFSGAVNYGISLCPNSDVLILNQDTYFTDDSWYVMLQSYRHNYALIGENIKGKRADFPHGYVHGTFMFMRRDAIEKVGTLNADLYPLWGSTAEWQLKVCRAGYKSLPLDDVKGFVHKRKTTEKFGSSIKSLLPNLNVNERKRMIHTPPEISVIIPTFGIGYTKYLHDAVASLIGGESSLGLCKPQTMQSFEIIVVEDGKKPETTAIINKVKENGWIGLRHIQIDRDPTDKKGKYIGKPSALNTGIEAANGTYITVLDVDDMMGFDRLETLWKSAEETGLVTYDGVERFEQGKRTGTWPIRKYDPQRLPYENSIHIGIFYKKELWKEVGGYNVNLLYGREDWAFNLAILSGGYLANQLDYVGYLYRREGQNRTIQNATPTWMVAFRQQMRDEYPHLYEEDYMCCGNDATKPAITLRALTIPGDDGMTAIIYDGSRIGSFTMYGVSTGTKYRVTPGSAFFVDNRDLYGNTGQIGFLEQMEHGRYLYKEYIAPAAPVVEKAIEVTVKMETTSEALVLNDIVAPVSEETILLNDDEIFKTITSLRAYLKTSNSSQEEIAEFVSYELANANRSGALTLLEGYVTPD